MTTTVKTMAQILEETRDIDWTKVDATTDAEIARQIAEDPDTAPDLTTAEPPRIFPQTVRRRLGMTQPQLAALLRISAATLRDWEQGHSTPEGAAEALLTVLDREPEAVLRALSGRGKAA